MDFFPEELSDQTSEGENDTPEMESSQESSQLAQPGPLPDGKLDFFHVPMIMGLLETVTRWQALAFNLGLSYPTVQKIETERRGNVERCMQDVIHNWLLQRDDVKEMGGCTKQCLITALREMEENAIVDRILDGTTHHFTTE